MPTVTKVTSTTQPVQWMERIVAQVRPGVGKFADCWEWAGRIDRNGYGKFMAGKVQTGAHRAAWIAFRSDIPDGLQVDHLCRNRSCVNPWHMDLVTNKVNAIRSVEMGGPGGRGKSRGGAVRSTCRKGHSFDEANTYLHTDKQGYVHRVCRACARARHRAWLDRQSKAS